MPYPPPVQQSTPPPSPSPSPGPAPAASSTPAAGHRPGHAGVTQTPPHTGAPLKPVQPVPQNGHDSLAALINAKPAAAPQTHAIMHSIPWWLRFPVNPPPLVPHIPAALLPYSWLGLAIAIALVLNGVFITYLVTLITMFVRHKPRPEGDSRRFGWHFLIPCRDEEAVIGGTIGYLTEHFPQAHVWVIDDDSEDTTGTIVRNYAQQNPNIHLVARKRPDARTGKSEALNAAYRIMSVWLDERKADRAETIIAVVDADGRLAPGSLDVVAADHLFGNPETGAVQIEVRMINRHERTPIPQAGKPKNLLGRVLIRLQDIEFRTVCSAVQMSRRVVHTVAMGGNGQFMRLTVLDAIGGEQQRPWRGSLQEDFEIGLHVLLTGARTEYTPDTYVDQEALPDLGRLVVQRTRWSQGMMQCVRYLPELWRSRHLSHSGVLELSYCLVQPWVQLASTLLYPLPWVTLGVTYLNHPAQARMFGAEGGWSLVGLYLVAALTQLALWGIVYWRKCERPIGVGRGVGFGVAFSLMVYISYLATWRAFFRIVLRRNGWSKTRRNAEFTGAPACETAAAA
jgi:cellulose synthase/poly-beta-1,6-N-acetylglucosamine synthase-like glycosyltransferase